MFVKLHKNMFYGSMMGQPDIQLVFVCLLAHCDAEGYVELPPALIATLTGLNDERVQTAINSLESPDELSRTENDDGKRIERIHQFGAWSVVNYLKYRAMRDADDRAQQNRDAKQRQRERQQESARVSQSQPKSAKVSPGQPLSAQGEGEGEGEGEVEGEKSNSLVRPEANDSSEAPARGKSKAVKEPPGFAAFYAAYPRKVGRRAAALEFERAQRRHTELTPDDWVWVARQFAAEREGQDPQFTPHPRTWLFQDRYVEYFDNVEASERK